MSLMKISKPAQSAFWFIACTLIQKALAFITVPFFTRVMPPEQYGIYNLFQTWSGILVVLCTMNMESGAFVNGFVKNGDERAKLVLPIRLISITTICTLTVFGFLSLLYPIIENFISLPVVVLFLMFLDILSSPALRMWTMEQRFCYKFKSLVVVTLLLAFSQVFLGLYFVNMADVENKALTRILWMVLPSFVLCVLIYVSYVRKSQVIFQISGLRRVLNLQLPLIPYNLSMVLLFSSCRIFINMYEGAKAVAVYSVAYSIGQIISIIKQSIVDAFHPWIYEKLKNKDFMPIQKFLNTLLWFFAAIAIGLSCLAPDVVRIFAPVEYYDAVYIVPFVSAIVLFALFNQVFAIIETYYEHTKSIMYSSMIACVVNILLNILLIPQFGYFVSGFISLLSYMLLCYINYFFIAKIKEFNSPFSKMTIFVIPLLLSISVSSVILLYEHPTILRGMTIILCLILICFYKKIKQVWMLKGNNV